MNKFKKSQILMLTLLAALLFVTPLLSSTLRPKYLYFIINLLIIALGAEAGLLSAAFSQPLDYYDHKTHGVSQDYHQSSPSDHHQPPSKDGKTRVVEKSASEKIVVSPKEVEKVKKCPSMPSLFFIGNGDVEVADHHQDLVQEHEQLKEQEEEVIGEISGQELYTKAETFIGNFYKQLKMQREDSWKKIHGFYQKAF